MQIRTSTSSSQEIGVCLALHIILWLYSEDFALGAHLIILVRDMLLARYLCLFVYLFFVVVRNLFHVVGFDLL
jgi:hypothetical protein